MYHYRIGWFTAAFLLATVLRLDAQQSPVAAGSEATGSGGTVSWSLGQVFASSQESNTANLNQGVQQPYEIFVVSSSEEAVRIGIRVFPNPTIHQLTLQLNETPATGMHYQLTDLQGRSLLKQAVTDVTTDIPAESLPPGTYLLTVTLDNTFLHTFQIIKH